jgi:hypothetical protein
MITLYENEKIWGRLLFWYESKYLVEVGKNYDVKTAFVVVYQSNPDDSYYRLVKTYKIEKVQINDGILLVSREKNILWKLFSICLITIAS